MVGASLNSRDKIVLERCIEGIKSLHLWRQDNDLHIPLTHLWWDDRNSYYSGQYSGWKCCSVCGPLSDPDSVTLRMDHCHKTGLYRGLLCNWCNTSEGHWANEWWTAWRLAAPNLQIGRRRVHVQERYTSKLDAVELMGAPMSLLLKTIDRLASRDGRLTNPLYA